MTNPKQKPIDVFEAAALAKAEREKQARKSARKQWLADHFVEVLALITSWAALAVAIIALCKSS